MCYFQLFKKLLNAIKQNEEFQGIEFERYSVFLKAYQSSTLVQQSLLKNKVWQELNWLISKGGVQGITW